MGRVRAPARLRIYVSERQKKSIHILCKEESDAYFGHLYHDTDHTSVSLRPKNVLTPYALQEKKPFTSFVKERSLS